MEDEKYQELLMQEYKALYEALKVKGFHLYELKYSRREEGIDLFNADRIASWLMDSQNKKIDIKV